MTASAPLHKERNENLTWLPPEERLALQEAVGIKERRVARRESLSQLCLSAARCLLQNSDTSASDIDLLLLVTQTSPSRIPSLVYVLQAELGLSESCACMEVNWGCAGYVYGLWLVGSLLQHRPVGSKAILLAGDLSTRCLSKRDQSTVPLFSDAVSATLLEKKKEAPPWYVYLGSDGKQHAHIRLQAEESHRKERLKMDGMAIFQFALQKVLPHLQCLLQRGPWHEEEIDYVVCHQASRIVNEAIRKRLGVPRKKFPYSLTYWGNTSSATIPITILTSLSDVLSLGSKRLLLCGFGTGLSWGSLLWESRPLRLFSCSIMSSIERPLLSVVVPVYAAERRLSLLVDTIRDALQGLSYELILIDDASRDNSWAKISDVVQKTTRLGSCSLLNGISLYQNMGQHRATFLGLCYGRGRYLATLDDDLQDPPEVLLKLLSAVQSPFVEVAYGVDNRSRSLGSRVLSKLLQTTGVLPKEASSCRLVSAELFDRLRKRRCNYLFLEALLAAETHQIAYVDIRRLSRCEGRSGYNFFKKLSISARILYSYTSFFLWMGLGGSAFLLLYGGVSSVVGILLLTVTVLSSYHKKCTQKMAEEQVLGCLRRHVSFRPYAD